jgi:hypothetical protein
VQVEFFDGTVIDATSDEDALERWRRIAAWSDPTAEVDPTDWQERILHRARVFHQANLEGLTGTTKPTELLDALAEADCLYLRRK